MSVGTDGGFVFGESGDGEETETVAVVLGGER